MNKKPDPDVLILGGGPAGISSALWCRELGLSYVVVDEKGILGGQINRIFSPITNYPGISQIEPKELVKTLTAQIADLASPILNSRAVGFTTDPMSIEIQNGETVTPQALIIATGVRRRILNVPGEAKFAGRGIIDSGAREPSAVAGKTVLIVGGGDAAIENATILAPFAKQVYIVHRRADLSARAEFIDQAKVFENVRFLTNSIVLAFGGNEMVETSTILSLETGDESILSVQNALIRIGVTPNSELFKDVIKTDSSGYVEVDSTCTTNIPGVFAVGDVANPIGPTIASAVGMGATAAKAALAWLTPKKSI